MHPRNYTAQAGLCEGETFDFGGEKLSEPGTYTHTFNSSCNCDSVVTLTLDVEPRLIVNMPETIFVCHEDQTFTVDYQHQQGNLDSMIVRLNKDAMAYGFDSTYVFKPNDEFIIDIPSTAEPTRILADVELVTPFCPVPHKVVVMEIRYNTSVIHQNNGILALTNERYNGGYNFITYQWLRDGQPISGATSSYLAMTDNDLGHTYSVIITREGWDQQLATCDIVYTGLSALENITIGNGPIDIYNPLGSFIGHFDNWETVWNLPAGIYIINNGKNAYKIVR